MEHSERWGVDMFQINSLTNNKTLTAITYTVFQVSTIHQSIPFSAPNYG